MTLLSIYLVLTYTFSDKIKTMSDPLTADADNPLKNTYGKFKPSQEPGFIRRLHAIFFAFIFTILGALSYDKVYM